MSPRRLLHSEAGFAPVLIFIGVAAIATLGIISGAVRGHGTQSPSVNQTTSFEPAADPFPPPDPTPIPDPSKVHAGIPVPMSDGTIGIPVTDGQVGVPVPTADGTVAIPVAGN